MLCTEEISRKPIFSLDKTKEAIKKLSSKFHWSRPAHHTGAAQSESLRIWISIFTIIFPCSFFLFLQLPDFQPFYCSLICPLEIEREKKGLLTLHFYLLVALVNGFREKKRILNNWLKWCTKTNSSDVKWYLVLHLGHIKSKFILRECAEKSKQNTGCFSTSRYYS